MKFAIVLVLLVAVTGALAHRRHHRRPYHCAPRYFCEYKRCQASKADFKGVDPQMKAFNKVLGSKVGPKIVKVVNMVAKLKLLKPVINLVAGTGTGLLKKNGQLEKLLAAGRVQRATIGPLLKRREQKRIYKILAKTTADCVACEVTLVVTLAVNGLLAKLKVLKFIGPLISKLLPTVGKLVEKLKFVQKITHGLSTALLGPNPKGKSRKNAGVVGGLLNTVNGLL